MANKFSAPGDRGIGASSWLGAQAIGLKVLGLLPFWPAAGWLLIFLALSTAPALGAEVTILREVVVHGQNLRGQLAQPVAAMKQELASQGCNQYSVALWTVDAPSRLRVEVRCVGWRWRVTLDPWAVWQVRQAASGGLPR